MGPTLSRNVTETKPSKKPITVVCHPSYHVHALQFQLKSHPRVHLGYYRLHVLKSMFVFGADGTICWAPLGARGTTSDSAAMAQCSLRPMLQQYLPLWIAGDSAFAASDEIKRPLTEAEFKRLRKDSRVTPQERTAAIATAKTAGHMLTRVRVGAEWGIAALKKNFHVLTKCKFAADDADMPVLVLEALCLLHNVRCRLMRAGQSATMFAQAGDFLADEFEDFQQYYDGVFQ
jgi:hypothetical protein